MIEGYNDTYAVHFDLDVHKTHRYGKCSILTSEN